MEVSIEKMLARLGIEAKLQGREWSARCPSPDHEDRNPSWRIRDDPGNDRHGCHNCFSCGFSGGPVLLVMNQLGLDWDTAVAWLGGSAADARPPPSAVVLEVHARRAKFRLPDGVDSPPFDEWVTPARDYARKRHLEPWQVERWGIGYAVDGPLGGRIVVPYVNVDGEVVGYTARTFVGSPKRYKEPDAHEGADRGVMFGERYWDRLSTAVLVAEGAFNALAVERALSHPTGHPNIAATAGSSLRPVHAAKLAWFKRVVIITDPDEAGDKLAAEIAGAVARHSQVFRVRLPEGTDADSVPEEYLREAILGRVRSGHVPRAGAP